MLAKRILVGGSALLGLGLLACAESVDSGDVKTSGMYANILATRGDDGKTLVEAALRVGGENSNTYVNLTGEDKLVATLGETEQDMVEAGFTEDNWVWYQANFEASNTATAVNVAFKRAEGDESALENKVTLPAPFALTAPDANASFSRETDTITVTWDESGSDDTMILRAKGDCINTYEKALSGDPGTYAINAGDLKTNDADADKTCKVTLELVRRAAGSIDPAFGEGGLFYGRQLRTLEISSKP